jgi:hypothetical protein
MASFKSKIYTTKMDQIHPQQKDPEFKNPALGGKLNFAYSWSLSYLDVLFSQDHAPVQREGTVDKASLSDWLSQVSIHQNPIADFVGDIIAASCPALRFNCRSTYIGGNGDAYTNRRPAPTVHLPLLRDDHR